MSSNRLLSAHNQSEVVNTQFDHLALFVWPKPWPHNSFGCQSEMVNAKNVTISLLQTDHLASTSELIKPHK